MTNRDVLVAKLRPDRFTAMSGKMAAIVGYIIDEPLREPTINDLVVTSDGFVLAERSGDVGANEVNSHILFRKIAGASRPMMSERLRLAGLRPLRTEDVLP